MMKNPVKRITLSPISQNISHISQTLDKALVNIAGSLAVC